MAVIELTHEYDAPASRLWDIATDFDALAEVCKPLVVFEGLSSGRCAVGVYDVRVRLFGVMPAQPYRMEVVAMDDVAMWLKSSEKGAGVKRWEHHLSVEETPNGSCLRDRIEIEAEHGWLTPVFAWWARKLYRHRHRPRIRLLEASR